jgi:hypothetical protein
VKTQAPLGFGNSRMKDFFDVWYLAQTFAFDAVTLQRAILATFARRGTRFPEDIPEALTDAFAHDVAKSAQWRAFVARSRIAGTPPTLAQVVGVVRAFIEPLLIGDRSGAESSRVWQPGVGWK